MDTTDLKDNSKMNKKLFIAMILIGLLVVCSSLLFLLNNPEGMTEVYISTASSDIERFKVSSLVTGDEINDNSLREAGITGMKIKEFKINQVKSKGKYIESDGVIFKNEFEVNNDGSIKQTIIVENTNDYSVKINISTELPIDYDTIYWNGTNIEITKTPIELTNQYSRDGTRKVVPNIFFGKENKRFGYRNISLSGGYVSVYQSNGENILEPRIDNVELKAGERREYDPTYANGTLGFKIGPSNAVNYGMCHNSTDLWVNDYIDQVVYAYDPDTGLNINNISYVADANADSITGIACNESTFYAIDETDYEVYVFNRTGGTSYTNWDTAAIGVNDVPAGGVGKIATPNRTGEVSDLWITDYADNFTYHTDEVGNNQTDGWRYNMGGAAALAAGGMEFNGSQFWIIDQDDLFVYVTTIAGVNTSLGFNSSMGSGAAGDPYGMAGNVSDYWIADITDDFVYHIKCTDCITPNTGPVLSAIPDGSTVQNVTWSRILDDYVVDDSDSDAQIKWIYINNDTSRGIVSIDNATNNISIVPIENALGVINITLQAIDTGGLNSTNQSFDFTITRFNNVPSSPTMNTPSNDTATVLDSMLLNCSDAVDPDGDPLYYEFYVNESYATFGSVTQNSSLTYYNFTEMKEGDYYWKCRANDITYNTYSNFTENRTFTMVNLSYPNCTGNATTALTANFTFADENTTKISAVDFSSTFTYWTTDRNVNKTITNSTNGVDEVRYCMYPQTSNVSVYADITYQKTGYDIRKYILDGALFTNVTSNYTLYFLSTGEGSVTFQIINLASQAISGAYYTAERNIAGTWLLVDSSYSDDAGTVTSVLDQDVSYRLTFNATGYDIFTTTITPTQSSYTIQLGGVEEDGNNTNYYRGISRTILPQQSTLLNDTFYNFSFNLTSSYYAIQTVGFNLTNGSGFIINATSCSANVGCIASVNFSTGNHSKISMNYYWIISGNNATGSRYWTVYTRYLGTSSFDNFMTDLGKVGAGFNDFTRMLIAFLVVIVVAGTVAEVSGGVSTLSIIGSIFATVGVLEAVNFIPSVGTVPYFLTGVIGLIFFGVLFYEYTR